MMKSGEKGILLTNRVTSGRFGILLYHLIFCFVALQSCIPHNAFISLKGDQADVKTLCVEYKDSVVSRGDVYRHVPLLVDTLYSGIPIDSIPEYLKNCDQETYHITDSARGIFVKYPAIQSTYGDTCYPLLHPQLTFEFEEPITKIEGPYNGVVVSKDQRSITLPTFSRSYKIPTAEFLILSDSSKPTNYALRRGLDHIGFIIDIPAGVGFGYFNGASGLVSGNGLFIIPLSLGLIFNRFRITSRLAVWNFDPDPVFLSNPEYENLSSVNGELGFGYEVLNSDYFVITPNIFGGRKKFEFSDDGNQELESLESDPYFTYGIGLTSDIKLQQIFRNEKKREEKKGEYFYLKLEGGLYPELFEDPFGYSGSLTYLNFAISGYFGARQTDRRIKERK